MWAVTPASVLHLIRHVRADVADTIVVIQPVLISVGHVQAEIAKLLDGLTYKMGNSGASSHPIAVEWIRQAATRTAP